MKNLYNHVVAFSVVLFLMAMRDPLHASSKLSPAAQAAADKAAAIEEEKKLTQLLKDLRADPQVGIDEARRLLREDIRDAEKALEEPLAFTKDNQNDWVDAASRKASLSRGWKGEQEKRALQDSFKQQTKNEIVDRGKLRTKLATLRARLSSILSALASATARPLNIGQTELTDDQKEELEDLQAAANFD